MTKYKFLYTISHKANMLNDLEASLTGLTQWIEPKDIIIVITPPYIPQRTLKKLHYEGYQWFVSGNMTPPQDRYMEKLYQIKLCEEYLKDVDTLFFLDADTLVYKNPLLLLDGEYDFSARVGVATLDFNFEKYITLQDEYIMYPMFNTGFMIFKNGSFRTIIPSAIKVYEENRDLRLNKRNYPDQLALMFGLERDGRQHTIRYMSKREHGFRWECESHNTVVYHGSMKKPLRKLLMKILEYYRYVT